MGVWIFSHEQSLTELILELNILKIGLRQTSTCINMGKIRIVDSSVKNSGKYNR